MKIHFDNVEFQSKSGPNTFGFRLAKCFVDSGHQLCEPELADVSLVFIETQQKQHAKKIVQRLDGIWFKPEEFEKFNVNIKELYSRCDAVVWQSEFDKGMTTHWWGDKVGVVIHNGIENVPFISNGRFLKLREYYSHVFVCSANWHSQKRLHANIELFYHLKETCYPNSCLIVMGANPDVWHSSPCVYYTGSLSHEDCDAIYSIADWMIHLAWLDHCPNVVIEALNRNVPVICSSSGGTKEIVKDYGVVLPEQSEYCFELVDYDKPPKIDIKIINKLPNRQDLGLHANIDIKHVMNKYIELFETIL